MTIWPLALGLLLSGDDWVVRKDGAGEIRYRKDTDGLVQMELCNRGAQVISLDVIWKEFGLSGSPRVSEGEKDLGRVHGGFARRLEAKQCVSYRVKPDTSKR